MNQDGEKRLFWLESYIDQSVTFTSWKKVETKMNQVLKQNLEKKLMDPVQRQILFQLLGDDFVKKNFPSYTTNPDILNNVRREEKVKKTTEMKAYISSLFDNAIQKKGSKHDNNTIPSDLAAFSQELQNLIDIDHQKHLAEGKSKKKQRAIESEEKLLIEILSYDPTVTDALILKLQRSVAVLSDPLRLILWPACIASKEKPKNRKNESKVMAKFSQLYASNQSRNYSSLVTDDLKDISTVVKRVYKESKSLKSLNSSENIKCSVDILNMCHNYGRQFEPHYANYAAVIQHLYLRNKTSNDEDYGTAAMMLEKLLRVCVLSSEQILKISNKIIQIVHEVDGELILHIKERCATLATNIDAAGDNQTYEADSTILNSRLKNPAIYLQKWITDGFVSILNLNSLFFIWDQLHLNKWEHKVLQQVCLALLGLLKPWFMVSKNHTEVEKVFLEEPNYLYLLDIKKAFGHIHQAGNFLDVPDMNRNIKYTDKPLVLPSPVPRTPSPKFVAALPVFVPWVPYSKDKHKDPVQMKTSIDLPFDFYIDAVRFVPDNATVIKVTGKVLNMYLGKKDKFVKFQAYPDLASYWRYPMFQMKQTVNRDSIPMNPDVVIMIRVYTIEKHSRNVTVLGSCLFGPFSNKYGKQVSLRVGGHQIRVRHGIPNPDFTVEHMLSSYMDDNPAIPGITLLLRVLPHQKEYIKAPKYESNYYRSELAKPNDSEIKLYKHYQQSKDFSMLVRDVALLLCGQASANDEALLKLLQQQLVKEGSEVEDFPYERFVNYNQDQGIMVLADKASGLPLFLEGRYLQCLVQILPGEETRIGNGKNQVSSFITEELELESPQRSPDWSDGPTKVKPEYDDKSVIFVTLYGLRPRFDPSSGKVFDKEGKEPSFNLDHAIAWSATNFFDKGAVYAGTHHVPLLKGRPPDDVIEKLGYLPLDYICKKYKSQVKVFDAASIEIAVWDGRFSYNECPPLPTHTTFLNISSHPEKYIKASEQTSGVTAETLLKQGLPNQTEFNIYKDQIVRLLKVIFKENIDKALRKAGYAATL